MANAYKYKYSHSGHGELTFEFKTDNATIYALTLKGKHPDQDIYIFDTSLDIIKLQETTQLRDIKIEKTIKNIIRFLFRSQPNIILLFCCYNLDGKGKKRKILFDRWFSNYRGKKLEKYYCNNFSDKVPDAFIIMNKSNKIGKDVIERYGTLGIPFNKN